MLCLALTSPSCLSETLIDNYEDRELVDADEQDSPDLPSVGGTDAPVKPLGPNAHQPSLSILRLGSGQGVYRPLLASSSETDVLFVAPTEGAEGPSLEVYSLASVMPTRMRKFPDDPLPSAVAIDGSVAVILGGTMTRPFSYGGSGVKETGQGHFVVKLDSDWNFVAAVGALSSGLARVSAIAVDGAHRVYVAVNVTDEFANERPEVWAYDASLRELFHVRGSMSEGSAMITSLSVSADGTLLVGGRSSASLQFSEAVITPSVGVLDGWYARCDPEVGRCSSGAAFDVTFSADPSGYVDLGPMGERLAATMFGDHSVGGTTTFTGSVPYVLSGSVATGGRQTQTRLAVAGQADALVVTPEGTSYVSGRVPSVTQGAASSYGFVAEVQADGTLTSGYVSSEPGILNTAIAANRNRVIWLAASSLRSSDQGQAIDVVSLTRLEPIPSSP
jgi:hypothetical protein